MSFGRENLLSLVQTILEKMDSDEVNSIHDTVESVQVAGEVRDSYRAITAGLEEYQRMRLVALQPLSDVAYFNQLKAPDTVVQIENLWYDVEGEDGFSVRTEPIWLTPYDFIQMSSTIPDSYPVRYTTPFGGDSASIPVKTDADPKYYTSFDNNYFFFDSVNLAKESTLQANRTSAWAVCSPEFLLEDTFIPDLRVDEFPLLLNEAIDASYVHFKGVSNSKAQIRARRQRVRGQNNRRRVGTKIKPQERTTYGRRPRG